MRVQSGIYCTVLQVALTSMLSPNTKTVKERSAALDSATLALLSMRFLIGQAPAAGRVTQLLPTRSEKDHMPLEKLHLQLCCCSMALAALAAGISSSMSSRSECSHERRFCIDWDSLLGNVQRRIAAQ